MQKEESVPHWLRELWISKVLIYNKFLKKKLSKSCTRYDSFDFACNIKTVLITFPGIRTCDKYSSIFLQALSNDFVLELSRFQIRIPCPSGVLENKLQ